MRSECCLCVCVSPNPNQLLNAWIDLYESPYRRYATAP
jgi:hypothetical protein